MRVSRRSKCGIQLQSLQAWWVRDLGQGWDMKVSPEEGTRMPGERQNYL